MRSITCSKSCTRSRSNESRAPYRIVLCTSNSLSTAVSAGTPFLIRPTIALVMTGSLAISTYDSIIEITVLDSLRASSIALRSSVVVASRAVANRASSTGISCSFRTSGCTLGLSVLKTNALPIAIPGEAGIPFIMRVPCDVSVVTSALQTRY